MLLAFFLKGILVGLVIAVPVGPVGIMCVRRTIFEGKLVGLVSGLGAATGDAVFGIIAGFGLTVVSDWLLGYQEWLRAVGGCFLLWSAASSLLARPQAKLDSPPDPESLSWDYASTFALTLANPITILAFVGIFAAIGLSGAEATLGRAAILVLGVWVGSLHVVACAQPSASEASPVRSKRVIWPGSTAARAASSCSPERRCSPASLSRNSGEAAALEQAGD